MKYIYRYILLALYAVSLLVSCIEDEGIFDHDTYQRSNIQVIGAVVDFDNKVVGTKALGSEEDNESLITEMTMFIFDKSGKSVVENGYVTINNYNTNPDAFMIEIGGNGDKGIIGTLNGQQYEYDKNNTDLEECTIYILANSEHYKKTDDSGNKVSVYAGIKSKAELLEQILPLEGFEMPRVAGKKVGFPMIGTTEDGTTFNLLDASKNQNTVATIPLRKLYSKVTVNMLLHADQIVKEPEFELLRWSIINSPNQVRFDAGAAGYVTSYENSQETKNATNQKIIHTDAIDNPDPASVMSFTFYMPEHLLTAEKETSYEYPTGILDNEKQRFKPALLGNEQKATYVLIEGTYTDHNGLVKQVSYRLYLGQNNYNDFKVVRNQHLINQVIIKGLTNSTNAIVPGQADNISVDHRVNIENEGLSIAMERETLMDAHFEFRPVDITLSPNTSLTVTVPETDRSWIAIEQSQPDGANHVSGVGIRKYFTTNLISTLTTAANESDAAGPVLTYNNETDSSQKYRFWVYVDENHNVYDKTGHDKTTNEGGTYTVSEDESRMGKIVFTFTDAQGTIKTIDYNIVQRNLWRIWNRDWDAQTATEEPTPRYYDIEYHEEYLHNYAADDSYGATTDGMKWGLDGVQLSNEHNSFKIDEDNEDWNTYVADNPLLKYDFYIGKYDTFADNSVLHNYAGKHFTEDIYEKSKGGVKVITMAEQASGAVEYCYNRNKRKTDDTGAVAAVEWYLPSADEMEEIIVAGYSSFHEFQNKYYWTSQPAYIRNAFYYEYRERENSYYATDAYAFVAYEDNTGYARATKVLALGNDQFDYAKSGLNKTPEITHDMDDNCIRQNAEVLEGSYFNVMYGWYRKGSGNTSTKTMTTDDHFNSRKDNTAGKRYHVHLGHLYDMTQEGYQERTKINRVRCVYRSGTI